MTGETSDGHTRREVLKTAAYGAMLMAGGSGLAACSSGSASQTTASSSAGAPQRGGVLRAGVTGGGSGDTLDPHIWVSIPDGTRVYQLYNSLVAFDKGAQPQLSLAEEFSANADATKWTVRLKKGITFHNGKDLTADDVIFTYQRIADPKNPLLGAQSILAVDVPNIKKLDTYTVEIPCHTPFAALYELQSCYDFFIVPTGFNPKSPIGTGPFKYESFTPGQQSTFVRNDNYWDDNLPYADKVIVTDYADETSQINGLLSGQLDLIDALSGASIPVVQNGGGNVLVTKGGSYAPFTMRVDKAPFDDVRVRQALRLVVDRKQMLELVFGGNGLLGNDLFGVWDATYDRSLPQRDVDVEQARSLLKQAGQEGLTTTLVTCDVAAGSLRAAEVFAQQAAAAGVTVHLKQIPVSELFGPNYLKWTFAQDVWGYYPYIPNVLQATVPGGVFNECHVDYPAYNALFKELNATVDPSRSAELTHEMQRMEYEAQASGYIIPYFTPAIDGYSKRVHGLVPSKTSNPFGGYDLAHVWLS